jgi:hypothetical protein
MSGREMCFGMGFQGQNSGGLRVHRERAWNLLVTLLPPACADGEAKRISSFSASRVAADEGSGNLLNTLDL